MGTEKDKDYNSMEWIVTTLKIVPEIDRKLFLEACELLEDEKMTNEFAVRKWLLRKLWRYPKFCRKFILSIQISAWFHWYTHIIFQCWRFCWKSSWFCLEHLHGDAYCLSLFLKKVTKFYISYHNPFLGLGVEITLKDVSYWTYFRLHLTYVWIELRSVFSCVVRFPVGSVYCSRDP